jgi:hypothetical protein
MGKMVSPATATQPRGSPKKEERLSPRGSKLDLGVDNRATIVLALQLEASTGNRQGLRLAAALALRQQIPA